MLMQASRIHVRDDAEGVQQCGSSRMTDIRTDQIDGCHKRALFGFNVIMHLILLMPHYDVLVYATLHNQIANPTNNPRSTA